jgi:hypothetical protein
MLSPAERIAEQANILKSRVQFILRTEKVPDRLLLFIAPLMSIVPEQSTFYLDFTHLSSLVLSWGEDFPNPTSPSPPTRSNP